MNFIVNIVKKKGHSIDQCFKLIGYPDWWNKEGTGKTKQVQRSANIVQTSANQGILGSGPQSVDDSNDAINSVTSGNNQFDPVWFLLHTKRL